MLKKKKVKVRSRKIKKAAVKSKKTAKKIKSAKKRTVKKSSARKSSAKKIGKALPAMEKIGEVTHYFPHVNAAAVMLLKDGLKTGDVIYLKGHTTDFKEKVTSIQLDHANISEGKKAQEIGLYVKSRVRIGDGVYKL